LLIESAQVDRGQCLEIRGVFRDSVINEWIHQRVWILIAHDLTFSQDAFLVDATNLR